MAVSAGARVTPDFDKTTDIKGWVWCTADNRRSGWTPREWLSRSGREWLVTRDYDAVELTVVVGEELEVTIEESGFYWATNASGESGWIPCDHVIVVHQI